MWVKKLESCEEFMAGDESILRELLHPEKEDLKLRYSLAHAKVKPQKATTSHTLKTSEVYYILEGKGLMHIDQEAKEVGPGDCVYIPPNAAQYIENTGSEDLNFLAIVDPAWRKEDETIL